MSHRAMVHVARYPSPEWSAPTRHVAIVLAEFVNDTTGLAWPSDATLAERTGLGRRSVQRAMAQLARDGAIKRVTRAYARGGRDRVITWQFWPITAALEPVETARAEGLE